MTTKKIAEDLGVNLRTVQRRLSEYKSQTGESFLVGEKSTIPAQAIEWILSKQAEEPAPKNDISPSVFPALNQPRPAKAPKPSRLGNFDAVFEKSTIGIWLIRIAIATLGARASWGVFIFARWVAPDAMAIVEACSLEATYIGLSFLKLDHEGKRSALWIAAGALLVSVIYNTLAAGLLKNPHIFDGVNWWGFWGLCILHGPPMATLAFLIVRFVLQHQKKVK